MFILLLTVGDSLPSRFLINNVYKIYFNDFKCMANVNKHYCFPQNYLEKFKTSSYNNL